MNNLKKVYKHLNSPIKALSKTELAAIKVELGIIDDLNKIDNSSQSIIKEVKEANDLIARQEKLLPSKFKDVKKTIDDSDKLRDKFFDLEDKYISAKQASEKADKLRKGAAQNFEDLKKVIKKNKDKNEPKIKTVRKNIGLLEKLISNAEKMAKELGVKIPTNQYLKTLQNLRKLL
jgi:DNA repair exonuclease SbcCD ATPase subunit